MNITARADVIEKCNQLLLNCNIKYNEKRDFKVNVKANKNNRENRRKGTMQERKKEEERKGKLRTKKN